MQGALLAIPDSSPSRTKRKTHESTNSEPTRLQSSKRNSHSSRFGQQLGVGTQHKRQSASEHDGHAILPPSLIIEEDSDSQEDIHERSRSREISISLSVGKISDSDEPNNEHSQNGIPRKQPRINSRMSDEHQLAS